MGRVLKVLLVVIMVSVIGGSVWWAWYGKDSQWARKWTTQAQPRVPDPERYEFLVAELARWRGELAGHYRKARNEEQRKSIEQDARVIVELIMPEMMRCWIGTDYDFNGISEKPGEGPIACGYYVSTVIRDAGFQVNRYKLAQQPSQNIIRTFVTGDNSQLRVNQDYEKYANWVENRKPGIYIVGLDTHVGFIVVDRDGMKFLHSSGIDRTGVVEETRDDALALKWSRWRMLGHFSGEPEVMKKWLLGEAISVHGP